MRRGTSTAYRETEDGRELCYRLEWGWTPIRPATYWEPSEGGVEALAVYRDGEPIGEGDVPDDVWDELRAEAWERTEDERMLA